MADKFPFPFVIPNKVVRTCDYYYPIDETGQDVSKYPICEKCNTRNFQARWLNNGSNKRGGKDFFCKKCSVLINLRGKDIRNDRRLTCYNVDGNNIVHDENTPIDTHCYSILTSVDRVREETM
jgi:ribosomal protein L40E